MLLIVQYQTELCHARDTKFVIIFIWPISEPRRGS